MEATTATLQDINLVEHVEPPLPLTILDIADWAREFSEFGEPLQLPWLPPIELALQQPGFSIAPTHLPRLLLRSLAGGRSIQIQEDRFAFGWSRSSTIGEPEKYPGYEQLRAEQSLHMRKYRQWCVKRFGVAPKTRLVELSYNNAAPLIVAGGRRRRLGEIFKWVQPSRSVNSFQVGWMELLEKERTDAPRVNAFVAVGAAPPVMEALIFNFAGFAPIDNIEESTIYRWLDTLHTRILDMYDAAFVGREQA
jgi:hypothetical protein